MVRLLYVSKMIFLFCLICICFFVFGLNFITKFLTGEITVSETFEQKEALKPPAITICPQVGWKNSSTAISAGFGESCKLSKSAEQFWKCLETNTFNFNEVVLSATHGVPNGTNLTEGKKLWTWSTPARTPGRCYTLLYNQPLKVHMSNDAILLNLAPNDYFVYFHDTDFFAVTYNPFTLPVSMIDLNHEELGDGHLMISLAMVSRENRNRIEMPCNPVPEYSFTNCIKESLAKNMNCSLPWVNINQGFSFCLLALPGVLIAITTNF